MNHAKRYAQMTLLFNQTISRRNFQMRRILGMIFLALACSVPSFAQVNVDDNRAMNHVFAQFADGRFADGSSYRSTMMISADKVQANCTWNFYGVGFAPISVTVPAYNVYRILSPGTAAFDSGYATLTCNTPVTAQVLYTYIAPSGLVLSEATVFSSPPATIAEIILDVTPGKFLGVAIVNNSDAPKSYAIAASESLIATFTIPARSQISRFVNELIPGLPSTYFGSVIIVSSGTAVNDVYAIGLRFTGSAFTTLPATSLTP